ncbi:MAG: DUF692 domain-containing protein [Deltaproteobacteria bacterium]|nr:DUF692 domain-containing protein [Deltaproteobacteria bacterium]
MSLTDRPPRLGLPDLGCGVGFRVPHYAHVFEASPAVDFLEVISENFLVEGGLPLANLERAMARYPLVQHGVSLGIGATTPLDWEYLRRLKALTRKTRSPWLTDHLCWTRADGVDLHDLLPLPYTEEAVRYVAERVRIVQDFLELRVGLENTSSYLTYRASTLTEWDFLTAIAEEADCGLLLDVNNVYVSAYNHDFDATTFIDALPADRVLQFHLAGHTHKGAYILDTHSDFVIEPVWDLYRHALRRTGPVSTLVEWDDDIPEFDVVWGEAKKAQAIRDALFGGAATEEERA